MLCLLLNALHPTPADTNSICPALCHPCVAPQVHRARLASGHEVAVKLQYPGLKRKVRTDLAIMKGLCSAAKAVFPEFR